MQRLKDQRLAVLIDADNVSYTNIKGIMEEIAKKSSGKKAASKETKLGKSITRLISASINDVADDSGWAYLADVGTLIMKKQPDFDPRNFGFQKLTPLIRSISSIEIDERDTSNKGIKHIYIKNR